MESGCKARVFSGVEQAEAGRHPAAYLRPTAPSSRARAIR